jgi:hypothetical protein
VRLSIFSSENEIPEATSGAGGLIRSLQLAAVLALGLLGGLEGMMRASGIAPSTEDDVQLWCWERDRVKRMGREDVLLLGTSRIQQGFSLPTFKERYPKREVSQLAIYGGRSFTVLEDLAKHSRFSGTVICDVALNCFSQLEMPREKSRSWCDFYHHNWTLNQNLNRGIQREVQSRFLVTGPGLGINGFLTSIKERRLTVARYVYGVDRQMFEDYSRLAPEVRERLDKRWAGQLATGNERYQSRGREAWEADAREIGNLARIIEARGGRVVFVAFPVSGRTRREFDRLYPRVRFWQPFLKLTGVPGIDCTELEAFRDFECADGSHLDYREAPRFTSALCTELEKLGVLSR